MQLQLRLVERLVREERAWKGEAVRREVQQRGHVFAQVHRYAVQMVFRSQYLSMACGERSRPEPDSLKPPNGRGHGRAVEGVHPHRAAAQRLRQAVRDVDVGGPHRGGQSVGGVVGQAHRLGLVAEAS